MKTLVDFIHESLDINEGINDEIFSPGYLDLDNRRSKLLKSKGFVHYCGSKSKGLPDIEVVKSAVSEADLEFSGDESFCGFDYDRYHKASDDIWEPFNEADRYGSKRINTESLYKLLKGASKWFLMLRPSVE